jgi:hypothetical protein
MLNERLGRDQQSRVDRSVRVTNTPIVLTSGSSECKDLCEVGKCSVWMIKKLVQAKEGARSSGRKGRAEQSHRHARQPLRKLGKEES